MRKLILAALGVCSLLLVQSCSKKESLTGAKGTSSSKLKVNDVYLTGTVPTGTYKITTSNTVNVTNRTMGVSASLDAGAALKQLDYTINTGSDWRVTDLGNGYYSIINTFSGQAMTLSDAGSPEHASIVQYPYAGIDAQQWKIFYTGGFGVYTIATKCNMYKGAFVDPSSTSSGAPIKLETYTGDLSPGYFLFTTVKVTYQDQAATNFFKRTSGVTATDGNGGFLLSDGRVFWSGGDSNYNDYVNGQVNCQFNKRSVSWVQSSTTNWDWTQLTNLAGTTSNGFYQAPGSTFSWPAAGFQIGSTAYIYMLPNGGSSTAYLANVNTTTLAITGYTQLTNLNGMSFTYGFVKETDGFIYAFGMRPTPPYNIGADLLVARFHQSNPTEAWTFYNGTSTWANNASAATAVAQLASTSFGVCKINSKYVIVGSEFTMECDGAAQIYAYASTSNSPISSYGTKKTIYNLPDRLNGHIPFNYGAFPHPEFNANNELLVTYSINGYDKLQPAPPAPPVPPCVVTCNSGKKDPDATYRPRAIRVPFSLIDPAL